ncbi:purine-cytosine permease family protein [Gulosibacter chungangensis]|uniref:purine-cytosine permease family protein n=1 Tax=Gulosibacter chungangensis TaxID=979746 RepID=UPI001CE47B0C|nr:permease [Gulosibacter chungangensis]
MGINLTGSNDSVEATDVLAREVDDSEQMKRGPLTMAYYGVISAMFFVYIGAAMAMAYGTLDAFIGIALTILTYGIINMLLSKYSINNRTTVAEFSRAILGKSGAAIAALIFALVAIYYAVFEGSIVAYAFQTAFGGPTWMWYVIVVAYSTPLIIGGARRFLDKINGILMPLYWGGFVVAIVWAVLKYGYNDSWRTHEGAEVAFALGGPGWLATYAGYMGVWILMMFTMDFASLGRRKDLKHHQRITFGPVFYVLAFGVNGFFGVFLTFAIPGMEASETGIAAGLVELMGLFGLLVVFASQTRINTANYFLGAANLRTFGEKVFRVNLPNVIWVILSSIIIFLMMLLPIVEYILLALAWQGVLVTAWVAIAVTHILINKGTGQEAGSISDSRYRRFNIPGLIAWFVPTIIGILMIQFLGGFGATWGPIVTAILAATLYALLRRITKIDTALIKTISENEIQCDLADKQG